jgi:hypothetical protein
MNVRFVNLFRRHDNTCMKKKVRSIIPNLSGACYAVRLMFHISNLSTVKSIYFAYFQSIIKYGIIFGGNSSSSGTIFILQRKIIRIMVGAHPGAPCRSIFKI